MEALLKRLVMAHGSSRGSAVNVTNKTKQHLFFWDAVPKADYPTSRSIEPLDEKNRNKNCDGSWRKEFSAVDYGL